MKFYLLLIGLVTLCNAAEAMHVYNTIGNYYAGQVKEVKQDAKDALDSVNSKTQPDLYQKYVACVARTFIFERCTLCFCTDTPNVAICWDYEREKCALTQRFLLEQKDAINNDPNGVW